MFMVEHTVFVFYEESEFTEVITTRWRKQWANFLVLLSQWI